MILPKSGLVIWFALGITYRRVGDLGSYDMEKPILAWLMMRAQKSCIPGAHSMTCRYLLAGDPKRSLDSSWAAYECFEPTLILEEGKLESRKNSLMILIFVVVGRVANGHISQSSQSPSG